METNGKTGSSMTNKTEVEGQLLGGVLVNSIHSYGLAEDNKTLMVMVELADGHTAVISVCPGSPVTAHVVA